MKLRDQLIWCLETQDGLTEFTQHLYIHLFGIFIYLQYQFIIMPGNFLVVFLGKHLFKDPERHGH